MQETSSGMEQIREKFIQAESALSYPCKNDFEKREMRDTAWLRLYENEKYYYNVFKKRMWEININPDEGEFADCFFYAINSTLNHFNPENGRLENFFNRQWSFRLKDKVKEIRKRCEIESLDNIDNSKKEEKGGTKKGKEKDKEDTEIFNETMDIESENKIAGILVELLNAITHLNEHKSGKTAKKTYFKMFFTDFITEYCKSFEIGREMKSRERSIFAGMHIDFMDFYMKEQCRTFYRIQSVPLKSMKEIKGKGSGEEIKLPLPNQIYILYLKLSSSGNVTQMRNKYKEFCEKFEIRRKLTE